MPAFVGMTMLGTHTLNVVIPAKAGIDRSNASRV
jgi:hypothetical protein